MRWREVGRSCGERFATLSIRMMLLLLLLCIMLMIAHLYDTGQRCYVAADLACSYYRLNFMCLCLSSVQPRGPFGLMPLKQIMSMRIFLATMLPEWHGYFKIAADMLVPHAIPASARLNALLALCCPGPLFLASLVIVTATSSWLKLLLDFVVPDGLHQGTTLKNSYDDATRGKLSANAWNDPLRCYSNALPMLTCVLHADSAAPRCPGSYPLSYGVPETHFESFVVLPFYLCDAIAPLLGLDCMLNAGMVEHYAPMGSCTVDDMVACLVLCSYALMPLLVLLAILVLPPAHSTAQCMGADTSCYFLRPCHDNMPLRGHSSRRPSCAGADAASSYVFGGVGPFGDPGRVVQNLPNKNFMHFLMDFVLVNYGPEPHLLDSCYGGVDPFVDLAG